MDGNLPLSTQAVFCCSHPSLASAQSGDAEGQTPTGGRSGESLPLSTFNPLSLTPSSLSLGWIIPGSYPPCTRCQHSSASGSTMPELRWAEGTNQALPRIFRGFFPSKRKIFSSNSWGKKSQTPALSEQQQTLQRAAGEGMLSPSA